MSNSYRIRTEVGKDKSIRVQIDQDFEFLEILSLKLLQSQVYIRPCADYGVVVGRVFVNDGYGLPNCKVSIFIPLTDSDELNPVISDIYPYKSLSDVNDDGYRYNLLPYTKSYSAHKPTGTFFTREDVLIDTNLIEVYDKYYKYTAITNDSGDFMIFGVPTGTQTIHLDLDLSDIGEFSLNPQDLVRMGLATEAQLSGVQFRTSTNLATLPQIISINKTIEVEPFWGQEQVCNIGITRIDFDLSSEANIRITPNAIFMGSIISDQEETALRRKCKPKFNQGEMCQLITGPGNVLAIRQTVFQDSVSRPILESVDLLNQDIDDNGTWLIDVPMNLDYVYTNEFGEKVISSDPKVGVPTKGKYRFKIKWGQSRNVNEDTKRAYFLVPNIREYGWNGTAPPNTPQDRLLQQQSYSFSTDWADYADIQSAINCDDTFYMMSYNKVYTVSQMIDRFRKGNKPNRVVSIKHILDETCAGDVYKFPTNDVYYRNNFFVLLMTFVLIIARPILISLMLVLHAVYMLILIVKLLIDVLIGLAFAIAAYELLYLAVGALIASPPLVQVALGHTLSGLKWILVGLGLILLKRFLKKLKLRPINLPLMLYNQCEFCDCKDAPEMDDDSGASDTISGLKDTTGIKDIGQSSTSGVFPPFFSPMTYNTVELQNNLTDFTVINSIMGGNPVADQKLGVVTCGAKTPSAVDRADHTQLRYKAFSTSLTLPERINLFNLKSKYFNSQYCDVNRIRVKIEPNLNPNEFYEDNTIVLLLDKSALDVMTTGKLITFQDIELSTDPNCTGGTLNQFGNNAITGTMVSNNTVTITYSSFSAPAASPLNIQQVFKIPSLTGNSEEYHKFPIDIEYFQVITAMTYSNFNSQCSAQLPNSLNSRYLNNHMYITKLHDNIPFQFANPLNNSVFGNMNDNPLTSMIDYQQFTVVILVRGVDPYSERFDVQYDLSRLFGFTSYGQKLVRSRYKLNIPINGGYKNVKHNLGSNTQSDPYSNMNLYHDTFFYKPDSTKFKQFNSILHTYYSSLDINTPDNTTECQPPTCNLGLSDGSNTHTNLGRRVSALNDFTREWNTNLVIFIPNPPGPPISQTTPYMIGVPNFTLSPTDNRGYGVNEIVEGGSIMISRVFVPQTYIGSISYRSTYISPTYARNPMLFNNGSSGQQLVMRSDRLPTSTSTENNCNTYFPLAANANFSIFDLTDDGTQGAQNLETQASNSDNVESEDEQKEEKNDKNQAVPNALISSLNNCADAAPLKCYDFDKNTITVTCCGCRKWLGKELMIGGCFQLVTTPLLSIPIDFVMIIEWVSRTSITFAACNNVFSHYFTNNWINGTLYAFAFKNAVFYDNTNTPSNNYCDKLIYFNNKTNNFYYRSSPYDIQNQNFVGDKVSQSYATLIPPSTAGYGTNDRNILYPTTIMDLGPVNYFTKELILNGDYEGYVMDNLKSTTFNSVSDILNMLIISRMGNRNFIQTLFGTKGASIFSYFNRPFKGVDGDYPQMISINSELGVSEFEAENYPDPPQPYQKLVYFADGTAQQSVFGIFFSSDTQLRDYITPKRKIINGDQGVNPSIPACTFDYFRVFSQDIPTYQWGIDRSSNTIFGTQLNDWYTTPDIENSSFLHEKYQSLDRINSTSRYFRTKAGISSTKYNKGHIWSYDIVNSDISVDPNTRDDNSPYPTAITVGAPFHFYFGLKKGKSAWDRFAAKYIGIGSPTD